MNPATRMASLDTRFTEEPPVPELSRSLPDEARGSGPFAGLVEAALHGTSRVSASPPPRALTPAATMSRVNPPNAAAVLTADSDIPEGCSSHTDPVSPLPQANGDERASAVGTTPLQRGVAVVSRRSPKPEPPTGDTPELVLVLLAANQARTLSEPSPATDVAAGGTGQAMTGEETVPLADGVTTTGLAADRLATFAALANAMTFAGPSVTGPTQATAPAEGEPGNAGAQAARAASCLLSSPPAEDLSHPARACAPEEPVLAALRPELPAAGKETVRGTQNLGSDLPVPARPSRGAVSSEPGGTTIARLSRETAALGTGHLLPAAVATGPNLPGLPRDQVAILPGPPLESGSLAALPAPAQPLPENAANGSGDGLAACWASVLREPAKPVSSPVPPLPYWGGAGDGTPAASLDSELEATFNQTPSQTSMPAKNGYSKLPGATPAAELVGPKRLRALFSQDPDTSREAAALGWLLQASPRLIRSRPDLNAADVSPAQTVRADRVLDLINREVTILKQTGADSMAVLLRPDRHTELLLSVTQLNGRLEAQIRCERGDHEGLSRHWMQLTESLAQQNIHLQPLRLPLSTAPGAGLSSDTGASAFADPKRNSADQTPEASAGFPAENAGAHPAKNGKTKTRQPSRRGWETWA